MVSVVCCVCCVSQKHSSHELGYPSIDHFSKHLAESRNWSYNCFLTGFCTNEQGFANDFGCQLAPSPLPASKTESQTRSKMFKKKHRPIFELTCVSGENDASGYHTLNMCKTESASPDPLVASRMLQGERFDLTMLISVGSTLIGLSHQQKKKNA